MDWNCTVLDHLQFSLHLVLEEVVVEVVERLGGGLLDDVRVRHLVVGLVELHGPADDGAALALRLGRSHLQRDLEVLVEVRQLAVHHAVRHHLVLVVRRLKLLLGERQHRHRYSKHPMYMQEILRSQSKRGARR
uniref:Uncharacterized protein n=1 Tax=Zea mays TaxID=4577 RepID=A0A804MEZ1_MAIZE